MESRSKNPTEKLRETLRSKVEVDSRIAPQDRQKSKETIIEAIIKATQKLPVCFDQIMRVASHPQFRIVCTSIEHMREHVREMTDQIAAICLLKDRCMYLSTKNLSAYVINHEFRHADSFLRHEKYEPHFFRASFPILPTTDNVRHYESALDKGDARIRRYKQLWEKEKSKQTLLPQEKVELRLYDTAAQDCLTFPISDTYNLDTVSLPMLKQAGVTPGSIIEVGPVKRRVLTVTVQRQQVIIEMEPIEPAALRVFKGFGVVTEMLTSDGVRHKTALEKLIERDAYTFQFLSEKAIEIFYPEASAMLREDLKLAEREYQRDPAEVLISKQNIFQPVDDAHKELVSLSKSFGDKELEGAMEKKDFSYAVRRLSAHGGLELMKKVIAYVEADKKIEFDINSRSTNGNTALDWADVKIKDADLKQSTREFLVSKGAKKGLDLSASY